MPFDEIEDALHLLGDENDPHSPASVVPLSGSPLRPIFRNGQVPSSSSKYEKDAALMETASRDYIFDGEKRLTIEKRGARGVGVTCINMAAGVVVSALEPDGCGAASGLFVGDVLTAVNESAVEVSVPRIHVRSRSHRAAAAAAAAAALR